MKTKHLSNTYSIIGGSVACELGEKGRSNLCGVDWRMRVCRKSVFLSAWIPPSRIVGGLGVYHSYRIPKWDAKRVNRWATKIYLDKNSESERARLVEKLDSLCAPFLSQKNFIRWVSRREKQHGISDYKTMTAEQVQGWLEAVTQWKNKQPKGNK